jgi:GTP pyrophosphokinase
MVPLSYTLKNGDIIEVLTRPSAHPSMDWLALVKTSHARSRIKAWFRRQRHAENVVLGREALEREAARLGFDAKETLKTENLAKVARELNYSQEEDMLAAVGFGHLAAATVLGKIRAPEPPKKETLVGRRSVESKLSISAGGVDDVFIRRSRCCQPLPGDEVVGYVTRGKGMAIHRRECPNIQTALTQEADRITAVEWKTQGEEKHPVRLRIEALDRVGLLHEISSIFSERKTNIQSANIKSLKNRLALFDLTVDVGGLDELDTLKRAVEQIPDVDAVERVGPSANGKR